MNSTEDNVQINTLIALSIPTDINFGTLDLGATSAVNKTNVTNAGNVAIDIKVYGYANNATDSPNAFNCTGGNDKNISLWYLRYNVTDNIAPVCSILIGIQIMLILLI